MYRINSAAKQLELFKSVNGQLTSVANTPFTAREKQWYKVKAVVQGNTISCYVDGELLMEWTNPATELTAGGIGFRTTSAGVHFDDAIVSSINKAPEDIVLSHSSVVENTTAGGMVGTFSTIDPDEGETFAYMLTAGAGDADNKSFTISDNALFLAVTPDYEVQDSYL